MDINEKKIEKTNRKIDLSGFKIQDKLNPKIWLLSKEKYMGDPKGQSYTMKTEVKKNLLKIADDYFESLELPGVDIEDVTMTGSLANFNWSKYSDIDLHIVVDYDELPMDRDLVQDFFKSKTSNWNKEHDVKIYGYDVELYIQDINEPHHSTGIYSVLNNEWNVEPSKKEISFDDKSVKEKSERLMDTIEEIYDEMDDVDNETTISRVEKLTDKIKKMRQSGLETGGEFSVENIVFKVLRRNGMLDRLYDIKTVAYDKSVTLESINESDDFDWVRDSGEIPTTNYYDHCYDIVLIYFRKTNEYMGWDINLDGMTGSVYWSNDCCDEIIYATPYWNGLDHIPVDVVDGDGFTVLNTEIMLPIFKYEYELINWLQNHYFKEVYKIIVNELGPLPE